MEINGDVSSIAILVVRTVTVTATARQSRKGA